MNKKKKYTLIANTHLPCPYVAEGLLPEGEVDCIHGCGMTPNDSGAGCVDRAEFKTNSHLLFRIAVGWYRIWYDDISTEVNEGGIDHG